MGPTLKMRIALPAKVMTKPPKKKAKIRRTKLLMGKPEEWLIQIRPLKLIASQKPNPRLRKLKMLKRKLKPQTISPSHVEDFRILTKILRKILRKMRLLVLRIRQMARNRKRPLSQRADAEGDLVMKL